jgi:transposase
MTRPHQQDPRPPRSQERLQGTHPHAAGIDIHAAVHWVAVPPDAAPPPPPDQPPDLPAHVRSFGACTADLHRLADWLTRCGVKTVAMESTGIYWHLLDPPVRVARGSRF